MNTSLLTDASVIFVLLLISAFFSACETALTATSRARMHELVRRGNRRAAVVEQLTSMRERLIGTLLLGNNVVNIAASALATSLMLNAFGEAGIVYATLVMTLLVLVFAEVLPKTYAIINADRVALIVAPMVRLIVAVFGPIVMTIEYLIRLVLRLFGVDFGNVATILSAHEEMRGVIHLHHKEGGFVKKDRDMIGGILDLRELAVSDVMVHRTKIVMVDVDAPAAEVIETVLDSGHSRIPVWKEKPDNIAGILHAKDLLKELTKQRGDAGKIVIEDLVKPPWFVPDTRLVADQLNAFLRRKTHFAIVVDEYGEVMGLVTLEDIIEEIVGDISDEHDVTLQGVRQEPGGSYVVDGTVPIRDLNRLNDWSLPDEEATTVAGLVVHEAQMIPKVGQTFTFHNYRFEILRKRRHQITSLRITPIRKT